MIHSSHSKKDLIEIIELFELWDIEDYRDLSKPDLQVALWSYVKKLKKIKPDSEFYFIDDVSAAADLNNKRQFTQQRLRTVLI